MSYCEISCERVRRGQPLGVRDNLHMRVELCDRGRRAVDLRQADFGRAVDHLALQIRQRHRVVVDHAESAHPGRREIQQHRRAQTAGADHQHARPTERLLAGTADLAQHDVPGVAFEFLGRQHFTSAARIIGASGRFRLGCGGYRFGVAMRVFAAILAVILGSSAALAQSDPRANPAPAAEAKPAAKPEAKAKNEPKSEPKKQTKPEAKTGGKPRLRLRRRLKPRPMATPRPMPRQNPRARKRPPPKRPSPRPPAAPPRARPPASRRACKTLTPRSRRPSAWRSRTT